MNSGRLRAILRVEEDFPSSETGLAAQRRLLISAFQNPYSRKEHPQDRELCTQLRVNTKCSILIGLTRYLQHISLYTINRRSNRERHEKGMRLAFRARVVLLLPLSWIWQGVATSDRLGTCRFGKHTR